MRLKGIAKFTIRNEDGSIAYQEEHSNTITPALQKIFDNNLVGTVDYTKLTPILNKLLGGVCLWYGLLNENDIFLPKQSNAKLVAHAGQHTYSSASDDPTRGVPNDQADGYGPVENGFRWVWEWANSQGVGTIQGLTLTHADVGDYYNQLNRGTLPNFEPIEDISNYIINSSDLSYSDATPAVADLPKVVGINKAEKMPLGFYGDINHVVSIQYTEDEQTSGPGGGDWRKGHVDIFISKFTGTDLWLQNEIGDIEPDEERTITVPFDIGVGVTWQWANFGTPARCFHYVAYDETNKHVYFMSAGTQDYPQSPSSSTYNVKYYGCGSVLYVKDVDLTTGTITNRFIIHPIIHGAPADHYGFRAHNEPYEPLQIQVVDGCVILPLYAIHWIPTPTPEDPNAGYYDFEHAETVSTIAVRVDIRNGEIKDYIDGVDSFYRDNANSCAVHVNLGNGRMMYPNAYFEEKTPSTEGFLGTNNLSGDDLVRNTTLFGQPWRFNRIFTAQRSDSLIQFFTKLRTNAQDTQLRGAVLNKMYQASVFRLNTTVNKTSDQTMTVEYTITQVEDEES